MVSSLALVLALGAALPASAGTPAVDTIVFVQGNGVLAKAALPSGPAGPAIATPIGIRSVAALPSGRILAATMPPPIVPGLVPSTLNELLPDGSLREIRRIETPPYPPYSGPPRTADVAMDMALDSRGRLFLLAHLSGPTVDQKRLARLDPDTGETLATVTVDAGIGAIATAPHGLWAVTWGSELRKLDPETGALGNVLATIADGDVAEIETDSSGRLWFLSQRQCGAAVCQGLGSIDLATGVAVPAPASLFAQTPAVESFTIERRCFDTATARCLQGGRFRAEVEYAAYDGAAGSAKAAPARSADTAIFSFFDPDNWELMVKVLDGCAINEHFWVYSSASTDVEYTMTITDTETGEEKIYSNPLGRIALTVTDNLAFPCTN